MTSTLNMPSGPLPAESQGSPPTDEALILGYCESGDRDLFAELVRRYERELFSYLRRYLGDAEMAEDAFQAAFLQVHLKCAKFEAGRAFRPWLYTIAANKARDHLRARGRRGEVSLDATAGDEGPAFAEGLEAASSLMTERMDEQQRGALVRFLIDQMPEHLRLILIMGYYQQLPYAEIAEVLDVPVGTVKSRLHAAVNHFARLWHARAGSASPTGR